MFARNLTLRSDIRTSWQSAIYQNQTRHSSVLHVRFVLLYPTYKFAGIISAVAGFLLFRRRRCRRRRRRRCLLLLIIIAWFTGVK